MNEDQSHIDFLLNSPLKNAGIDLSRPKFFDSRKMLVLEKLISEGEDCDRDAIPLTKADFNNI